MNPIEWFEGLDAKGKLMVGAGAAGLVLLIWQPWKKSSPSTSGTTTVTGNPIASGTPYSGTGDTGISTGGGYIGGGGVSSSSGHGGTGSGDTTGGYGLIPVGTPVGVETYNPTGIGSTPNGQQVDVHPTSISISVPTTDPTTGTTTMQTTTSVQAHQTQRDKTAGQTFHSTTTDIAPKGTGGVTSRVVSTIASARNTNIVQHGNQPHGGYTVAQGGESYNAATNGAGGQWLVTSKGTHHFYDGHYTNDGSAFVASKGSPLVAGTKDHQIRTPDGRLVIARTQAEAVKAAGGQWINHKWVKA